jgi:hypothetical protein
VPDSSLAHDDIHSRDGMREIQTPWFYHRIVIGIIYRKGNLANSAVPILNGLSTSTVLIFKIISYIASKNMTLLE